MAARVRWAFGVLVVGAVVWLVWPSDQVTLRPDVPAAPHHERDARATGRGRRALDELSARYAQPTRTIKVKVLDCGRAPAVHAEVAVLAGGERVAGLSDDLGVFRAPVPEDASDVTASATLGTHHGIAAGSADVEVVICPGAIVEGVVHDEAGRPMRDAVVRFAAGQDIAVTEDDGEFVLNDQFLTAERVTVEHKTGVAELVLDPPLAAGEARTVSLVISAGRRVVGQVVDAGGALAPNVPIIVSDLSGALVARVTSDRDGRFWLAKIPFDAVVVRADAGVRGSAEATLARDATDLVLRLSADRGVVVVVWEGRTPGTIRVLGDSGDRTVGSGAETIMAAPARIRAVVDTVAGEVACGEGLLLAGARLELHCGAMHDAELIGRVLNVRNEPIVGATWRAQVRVANREVVLEGKTDTAGRFNVSLATDSAARASLVIGDQSASFDPIERRNLTLVPSMTIDLGDLVSRDPALVSAMFDEQRTTGTFGGIGGQLETADVGISFSRIVRDGPLDQAGVRPGDVILDIDGRSASQLTTREALLRLRGQAGTGVAMRLFRPGEGQLEIELERAIIDMHNGGSWVD